MKNPNFRFEIDPKWPGKKSWFDRYCARRVAKMIYQASDSDLATYQFGGYTGFKPEMPYEFVNASKFELMHWILREAGYNCCQADVMRRCGVNPDKRMEEAEEFHKQGEHTCMLPGSATKGQ